MSAVKISQISGIKSQNVFSCQSYSAFQSYSLYFSFLCVDVLIFQLSKLQKLELRINLGFLRTNLSKQKQNSKIYLNQSIICIVYMYILFLYGINFVKPWTIRTSGWTIQEITMLLYFVKSLKKYFSMWVIAPNYWSSHDSEPFCRAGWKPLEDSRKGEKKFVRL